MRFKELAIVPIFILFGGMLYAGAEVLFRGYSYRAMIIVGGMVFALIDGINDWIFPWDMPFAQQVCISTLIATVVEFFSGYILNICLHMGIWDYSNMPLNIMGQICLPFILVWLLLSPLAIILGDFWRWAISGFSDAEKPQYTFWWR